MTRTRIACCAALLWMGCARPDPASLTASREPLAAPVFERHHEQTEQAYSFEAPAGWHVEAALSRTSTLEWHTWDRIRSPDGQIQIEGGTPERFLFLEPNALTEQVGLEHGDHLAGLTYVAPYEDGATFGAGWLQGFALCTDVVVDGQRVRPDEAQRVREQAGDALAEHAQIDAVELSFTCRGAEGPLAGRLLSTTVRVDMADASKMWLGGVRVAVAPEARIAEAARVMEHTLATHVENPQWTERQHALQACEAEMRRRTQPWRPERGEEVRAWRASPCRGWVGRDDAYRVDEEYDVEPL